MGYHSHGSKPIIPISTAFSDGNGIQLELGRIGPISELVLPLSIVINITIAFLPPNPSLSLLARIHHFQPSKSDFQHPTGVRYEPPPWDDPGPAFDSTARSFFDDQHSNWAWKLE